MTQDNSVNVKLSNSQHGKSKLATKKAEKVALRLSSNMVGNTTDETNFSYRLFLNYMQASGYKSYKDFASNSSANISLSRIQIT